MRLLSSRVGILLAAGVAITATVVFFQMQPSQMSGRLAGRNLPADSTHSLLCHDWFWVQTMDAYQGGTKMEATESEWRMLSLRTDQTFLQETPYQSETGFWALDEKKWTLALLVGHRATRRIIRDSDYRHEIQRLTPDSLILRRQGRHGYVTESYLRQRPSFMPATDSLYVPLGE